MEVQGGTAMDAAVATVLCSSVQNMMSCGIGGGHFLTYYNRASGKVVTVNAREQAPSGADRDMFTAEKNTSSVTGGLAIGIPGEIKGLYKAWKLGGRLPWKQLLQPAIKLCKEGFKVGNALEAAIRSTSRFFPDFPNLRDLLTNPATNGIYKKGETMKAPKLAQTLETIAEEGPDAFYNGSLSANIAADIQDAGGIITEEDLANYTVRIEEPLTFRLDSGHVVYSPRPPSGGAVYLFILNILNEFRFSNDSVSTVPKAKRTWHRMVESFKHAYALRTQLGDNQVGTPAFRDYVDELVRNMTDPTFGAARRERISDCSTFEADYYQPMFFNIWDNGTSHLSVLGPNGDAVSITSTINLFFGSKVVGTRTGIVFNNEMDDFSTPGTINSFGVPASEANFIEPWKRPLSSMTPSLVIDRNGDVQLVVGASGGTRIIPATALVTVATLDWDWGIKEAIDYPRVHHQLFPETLQIQTGFPGEVIDGLRAMGHNITMSDSAFSVVQGILRCGNYITANSDYRKDGAPDGY
ncbi:glutathione hydrolase 1 proenzyme-like [Mya arenaria]|uniref:glutathione hydrolase 1 proenzyme-like n=1 Tax=Mya arenaria TaxID=6604 RepID=UPI0022DF993C|nr:glutathione hydrolase 1 proenzyme-like [Mya arenaria]